MKAVKSNRMRFLLSATMLILFTGIISAQHDQHHGGSNTGNTMMQNQQSQFVRMLTPPTSHSFKRRLTISTDLVSQKSCPDSFS